MLASHKDSIVHSPHFHYGKAHNHPMTACLDTPYKPHSPIEQSIIESYTHRNDSMLSFLLQSCLPPKVAIPSVKSDIKALPKQDSFVWFGHSSYMLWLNGKKILFDPVLEGSASPLPFMFAPFKGADIFKARDIGEIDYLIITHNHYDHLSKQTIRALAKHVKCAIVPLGIGRYLQLWGIERHHIVELDWEGHINFDNITFHCLPTRHYAMRGICANTSLWACFVLAYWQDSKICRHIFCNGDSSYGGHFRAIGKRFQYMDFAFIENGQYNMKWAKNHLFPHESLQAGIDLGCKKFMPIHNSKFALAPHIWKQPLQSLYALYKERQDILPFTLITPRIGEIIPLWEDAITTRWWEDIFC